MAPVLRVADSNSPQIRRGLMVAMGGQMAEQAEQPKMKATLGLTGVTVNAMALIAPGAFLWITFVVQAGYAYPSGLAMWAGIFGALMLAYATAISYSELAKLYPGAGSSYLFAEQAFLGKTKAYKFARIAKFIPDGHRICTIGFTPA